MSSNKGRPNFLIIMSDEHGAQFSSAYGHPFVRTPSMDRLAAEAVTFDAAYCNSPLCVPSRISFMTGRYNSRCRGWDNSVPLSDDTVTWPHLLRSQGYDVALSGKMHLVGHDHLHGFQQQLARDIHADLAHPIYPWYEPMPRAERPWSGLYEAGQGVPGHEATPSHAPAGVADRTVLPTGPGRTLEIEVDDEAEDAAIRYMRETAAADQARPFALVVGFIAPHFPFVVPEPYFSRYYPEHGDLPHNPPDHLESLPRAARMLRETFGFWGYSDEQVRRARAAYYGLVSYLDDKIGRLMDALTETGLAEDTVVIHTSDHGEMLGEHGIWRKMCFYEQAARIPLQIRLPGTQSLEAGTAGTRVSQCVSLVDVTATILATAGFSGDEMVSQWEIDGRSLLPLMGGDAEGWRDETLCEHNAHGTDNPRAMLRRGQWKLCVTQDVPGALELYDLSSDPDEFTNLAAHPDYALVRESMLTRLGELWDGERIKQEVVASQRERVLIRSLAPEAGLF